MPLVDLLKTQAHLLQTKNIQQILNFAGNGQLQNGNETSQEFREYLMHIPSEWLIRYAHECLTMSFNHSGFALQDIVNQIGRRLSFEVTDGLYQGRRNEIGFDGIWHSDTEGSIVIEVKTTDAYRISLDSIASYRTRLIQSGDISGNSSILIVVGREDTGDLESQIRGSRHSDVIRLVSVDALGSLLKVKESVESSSIFGRICAVLKPQEFTRVDRIIELVFSTAEDIKQATEDDHDDSSASTKEISEKPASFHEECIERISEKLGKPLTKQSRTTYRSADGQLVVSCSVSKEYTDREKRFWFAFHPPTKERLEQSPSAIVSFGCGSANTIFLFSYEIFAKWLPEMLMTNKGERYYWHVQITLLDGKWFLLPKQGRQRRIDISKYLI